MIRITGKIPRNVSLAWSGGVDSMAVLDFLTRSHNVNVIYVDHLTPHSRKVSEAARNLLSKYNVGYEEYAIDPVVPVGVSKEEHWRNERYKVFHAKGEPVITCHHLNDCVETWVWSSLHGDGKIIPYANRNVIRPFRTTRKKDFVNWCERKGVSWVEDESNSDVRYMRNYIRHNLMPMALHINPGLEKTIQKKVERDYERRF